MQANRVNYYWIIISFVIIVNMIFFSLLVNNLKRYIKKVDNQKSVFYSELEN